jgi:hypothetical protein
MRNAWNAILRTPSAFVLLLVAILTLAGVVVKGIYDEKIARLPIDATSTAEARLTAIATSMITQVPSPTNSVLPSETANVNVTQTLPAIPSTGEFKAIFVLPIAENVWPVGSHFYNIDFGCTTSIEKSFTGDIINFGVIESAFSTLPFFLRYDAVYDSMIYGDQINTVSQSSQSFASVVITRFTYDEAQRVLDECNAFISADGLQKIGLEKASKPVLELQEIDLADFQFLYELP